MLLQISENELYFLLIFTLLLMIIKGLLLTFLGFKMYQRKKETGEFTFGFVFGVFILILGLLISRIFFSIFDFYLTVFDPSTYYEMPNILFWKIASFIRTLGYAYFIYKTDQKALEYKFKGIFMYLLVGIALLQLLYPVSTAEDFYFVGILDVFLNVIAIIIPIIFITLAWKPSPYRIPSLLIAIGAILYAIGANLTIEVFLNAFESVLGYNFRIFIFLISLIFKATALTMFSFGISEFAIKFSK